ncbi:MAG: outer membrane protein assembly factor BamE [Coxiellaceae bacterium]|nr:outer membrane protein assembly factor BamE [Coxiellaceae bacterium]
MIRSTIVALIAVTCLTLVGCGSLFRVHRLDVQQGNVITAEMMQKLHKGMSRQAVLALLGDPVLTTLFEGDELEYVYTWKPGYGTFTAKRLTILFHNGRVSDFKETQFKK